MSVKPILREQVERLKKKGVCLDTGHLKSSRSSSTTGGRTLIRHSAYQIWNMAKYADNVGLLGELNDRPYIKY